MRRCTAGAAPLLLLLVAPLRADVTLADGRLVLDGFLSGRAVYWTFADQQWTTGRFEFQRGLSQAGVTGRVGEAVSARLLVDLAAFWVMDLYGEVRFPGGLGLRAGQFKLPLSFEMSARPEREILAERTMAYSSMLPAGVRDIGAMLSYRRDRLCAHAGVVNGAGTGPDDYTWKDFFGRVEYRSAAGLNAGTGGYWGSRDSAAVRWLAGLVDAEYRHQRLTSRAAVMHRLHKEERVFATSLEAAYDFGFVEPAARFDVVLAAAKPPEFTPVFGLNFRGFEDRVKVVVDFQYHKLVGKWLYQQLMLRVQFAL